MGKCLITVLVVGSHHAGNVDDIERLAARFTADLKVAGHSIERADMSVMAEVDLQSVEPTPLPVAPVPAADTPPTDAAGLRLDGPTPEEWANSGHNADSYPPAGYAPRSNAFVASDTSTWPAIWPAPAAVVDPPAPVADPPAAVVQDPPPPQPDPPPPTEG